MSKHGIVGIRNRSQRASAPSSCPLSTTRLAPPRSHSCVVGAKSFKYLILWWIIFIVIPNPSRKILLPKWESLQKMELWAIPERFSSVNVFMIFVYWIMDRDKNVWMNEMNIWRLHPWQTTPQFWCSKFCTRLQLPEDESKFWIFDILTNITSMRENLFFSKILTKSESVRFGTVSSPRPLKQFNW